MAREKFSTLTEQMFYILLCLREECCGMAKGGILFCEREYPLWPCRPQAAFLSHLCEQEGVFL